MISGNINSLSEIIIDHAERVNESVTYVTEANYCYHEQLEMHASEVLGI